MGDARVARRAGGVAAVPGLRQLTAVARAGTVRDLHALDPLTAVTQAAEVWWLQPTDIAVVLGSRQSADLLDAAECDRLGISVVKPRSGGGAVVVVPDPSVWVDIGAPTGSAPGDVRGSMIWAGELWRRALAPLIGDGRALTVHTGPMITTPWSDLVCFAGLGPGEIQLEGSK